MGNGAGSSVGSESVGHRPNISTNEFVGGIRPISFPTTHNQAFNRTFCSGAFCFAKFYAPLQTTSPAKLAPLRRLTWRYVAFKRSNFQFRCFRTRSLTIAKRSVRLPQLSGFLRQ
jgi:hypothetical protein